MPQYLLDHEQGLTAVHQKRRELVSQVVYAQMWQTGLLSQPAPHFRYRCVRQFSLKVDEHMLITISCGQLIEYIQR